MTADLADDLLVGHGPGVRAMIRLIAEQVGGVCVAVDMTREGRPRADRVQSVDRAVELLRAVAVASGSDSGAAALAQMCGLNRATAWRLLMTLEEQGMVARNPHNGWFTLGPTFLELRASVGRDGLVEAARPVLQRLSLETGETACLGLIDGDAVHYVAEVIPDIADEESWLERRVDLHAASMGKAFLAYVDPGRVREIIGDEPPRYTDATITNLEQFLSELDQVRAQGYAVCKGEMIIGSWGVSAPIFGSLGQPVAVLCLWGPDHRGGRERFDALGRLARRAAQDLSRAWPR